MNTEHRYLMVRIPAIDDGDVAMVRDAIENLYESGFRTEAPWTKVVEVTEHAERVPQVVELFDAWEESQSGFDLRDADAARSDAAEDLWQAFADLVPTEVAP